MAHKHEGLNNRIYGKIDTDDEFTKKIHHVMKLINQGYPVIYFRDKYNRVRVLRNEEWWVIDDLANYEKLYDWRY